MSTWNNIGIKTGAGGVGAVTQESKNATIASAVSTWEQMGLTRQQIAFGIATMGVESGFNSAAQATTTAYGLGQFTNGTWSRAVNYFNSNFGGQLDPLASRSDPSAQIAVMGAWITRC